VGLSWYCSNPDFEHVAVSFEPCGGGFWGCVWIPFSESSCGCVPNGLRCNEGKTLKLGPFWSLSIHLLLQRA
jgi:hypothetical protein